MRSQSRQLPLRRLRHSHPTQQTPVSASSRVKSGDKIDVRLKLKPPSHVAEAQIEPPHPVHRSLLPTAKPMNALPENSFAASVTPIRDPAAPLKRQGEMPSETNPSLLATLCLPPTTRAAKTASSMPLAKPPRPTFPRCSIPSPPRHLDQPRATSRGPSPVVPRATKEHIGLARGCARSQCERSKCTR